MNHLVWFLVAGAALLVFFLLWFLTGRPKATEEAPSMMALEQVVSLLGLASGKSDLLLDESDYHMLRSNPRLQPLARELRRDRREITLLWLKLLQEDVRTLWRFRRLLVRNGVSAGLVEELRIAAIAVVALASLACLRMMVFIAGPFALPALLRQARRQVQAASSACAALFSRVPPALRAEIERQWAAELGAAAGS